MNESEIRVNVEVLYSGLRDKRRMDPQTMQSLLHGLLMYKNTNTIWNSAVILTV